MSNTSDLSRFPALKVSGAFSEAVVDRFARYVETAKSGEIIRETGFKITQDQVALKGIAGDTRIYRIR